MRDLVLGNGRLAVTFDRHHRLADLYYPRTGLEHHTRGRAWRIGVEVDGAVLWVDRDWDVEIGYRTPGRMTEMVARQPATGLTLTVRDAVHPELDVLIRRIEVESRDDVARNVRVFLHHDFRILETDIGCGIRFDRPRRVLLHFKRDRYFLLDVGGDGWHGLDEWTLGRADDHDGRGVVAAAGEGELDRNPVAVGAGESLVSLALQVPRRGRAHAWWWLAAGRSEAEVLELDARVAHAGPAAIARAAGAAASAAPPPDAFAGLPTDIARLARDSLAIAETQIADGGGIIASADAELTALARESYAYVWPRDGALIALAFLEAGRTDVARDFLRFCRRALHPDGWLHQRYHVDGTPASSWHPTHAEDSPLLPIQEDETALVVWVAGRMAAHDPAALDDGLYDDLVARAADFLTRHTNPATGLPRPSHDLWEERFAVHAFTTAAVIGALRCAAGLAETRGHASSAEMWSSAAGRMADALGRHLFHVEDDRFARSAHPAPDGDYHLDTTLDASLAGLFLFGAVDTGDSRLVSTMSAVERALTVEGPVGGIARYEEDVYHRRRAAGPGRPGNPWIICTLWLADWQIERAASRAELAAPLARLEWAASHATAGGLLPEQLHPVTGEHLSVRPLTWSHSTLVLTALRWARRWRQTS